MIIAPQVQKNVLYFSKLNIYDQCYMKMGTWVPIGNIYNEDPLKTVLPSTAAVWLSLSHHHNTFIGFHIATWGTA